MVQKAGSDHTPPLGLFFAVDKGKLEPLLKVAALSGFKQMSGAGLKKQPTEKQMLDRFMPAVLGISDEALFAAVAKRDQQVNDVHDSIVALQEDVQD